MTKQYFSALEREARQIIENDRDYEDGGSGFSIRQGIRNAFIAMWAHALPADRVRALAEVMCAMTFDEKAFKNELNDFVKVGVLRARTENRQTLYEVNYENYLG